MDGDNMLVNEVKTPQFVDCALSRQWRLHPSMPDYKHADHASL